eukprot:4663717-Alexandrium_andersonii.AAC.1
MTTYGFRPTTEEAGKPLLSATNSWLLSGTGEHQICSHVQPPQSCQKEPLATIMRQLASS